VITSLIGDDKMSHQTLACVVACFVKLTVTVTDYWQ